MYLMPIQKAELQNNMNGKNKFIWFGIEKQKEQAGKRLLKIEIVMGIVCIISLLAAVVFVHGSGASNMDEKVGKLIPFNDIAY